jgi:UDP-N-acetyl-alpha-D-muramoyl-L-alanyl-L-glutamate epimerase
MPPAPQRAESFSYDGYSIDPSLGEVHCTYSTGGYSFTERYLFGPAGDWSDPAVEAAVRILYLMAGVSYYKTRAARVIDLGPTATTAPERSFLRQYFVDGLAEFAYRNDLNLDDISIVGLNTSEPASYEYAPTALRPLIPFGGGIDSIVTVSELRKTSLSQETALDPALCVVHPPEERFATIEEAAAATGLLVRHIARKIDSQLRQPERLGLFNGHVPITAIITAAALVAAVLDRRDAVVLSNEWSASAPTLVHEGRPINHQWSKGIDFEEGFAQMVAGALGPRISVFSYLRGRSELWVAQRFAELKEFHGVFRSCNRAFHQNAAERLSEWCGTCDKCCFIDLILSPFMDATSLRSIFNGHEPLDDPQLEDRFTTLLGLSPEARPFECVGDVGECRAAIALAAERSDRRGTPLLQALRTALDAAPNPSGPHAGYHAAKDLLAPIGPHFVPERYAPADLLVRAQ